MWTHTNDDGLHKRPVAHAVRIRISVVYAVHACRTHPVTLELRGFKNVLTTRRYIAALSVVIEKQCLCRTEYILYTGSLVVNRITAYREVPNLGTCTFMATLLLMGHGVHKDDNANIYGNFLRNNDCEFLADRTNGRAIATLLRLSSSVRL